MKPSNYLTFDLESWYDSEFVLEKNHPDFVLEGLNRVSRLLKKHNVKATFFVTGDVLEKYPEAIRNLSRQGHEIASHNYQHTLLRNLSRKEITQGLRKSVRLIKKITGKNPKGFRAPSWSISEKEFWMYPLLSNLKFTYSSSLFPIYMGLYGSNSFPITPFAPLKNKNFREFPIIPFTLGSIRIPFAGGVYFRILPLWLINWIMGRINDRGKSVIIYLHPWEFCPDIPVVKTTLVGKITTYFGLKRNENKLDSLLSQNNFQPLSKALTKT